MVTTTGTLSMEQIARLAAAVGFDRGQIPTAVAVAWAESRGRPGAKNTTLNSDGSRDDGLWQINSVHGHDPTWLHDPMNNAVAAKRVYDQSGWSAWTGTYVKGLHERYLPAARSASIDALGLPGATPGEFQGVTRTSGDDDEDGGGGFFDWVPPILTPGLGIGAPGGAAGEAATGPAGEFVRDLFNLDELWQQALSVGLSVVFSVAALALISLGLFRLTGNSAKDIYGGLSKAAGVLGPARALI